MRKVTKSANFFRIENYLFTKCNPHKKHIPWRGAKQMRNEGSGVYRPKKRGKGQQAQSELIGYFISRDHSMDYYDFSSATCQDIRKCSAKLNAGSGVQATVFFPKKKNESFFFTGT